MDVTPRPSSSFGRGVPQAEHGHSFISCGRAQRLCFVEPVEKVQFKRLKLLQTIFFKSILIIPNLD
jgi:hypothetical protein